MTQVHTDFGVGEIIASETVRGRTQHKIAVNGNQIWVDEAKLGITRVADAFAWQPPQHHPDAPADSFSHLGDEDPNYSPASGRDIQWDHSPAGGVSHLEEELGAQEGYDQFGDELGGALSPQVHENPGYNQHAPGYDPHRDYSQWEDGRLGWAPVDHDNSVNLPYDPTPQYPAIPGDTESTLQPIHHIDADDRLSPADSITFENREEDEGGNGVGQFTDNFAKAAGNFRDDTWETGQHEEPAPVAHEDEYSVPEVHPGTGQPFPPGLSYNDYKGDFQHQYPAGHHMRPSGPGTPGRMSSTEPAGHNVHEAFAFLIPLAEGLMGAGAGAAASGAAADAGAGMAGQAVARGVGSGAAHMMSGGGGDQGGGGDPIQQAVDYTSPGEGWGELQRGAALNEWLASRETPSAGIGAGLSDKYIDITSGLNYHEDPVAQFRHDPNAFISRLGHVLDEPVSPEMEHYGQLVESNASIREAAWNDVRQKAMRLRREGRVAIKDVDTDRIYASVEGDHGTYDVMIAKGGAFGGFGGGHTITNWRCACEWGRWAFRRQMTYVGRLCSHAYASYLEMQSAHMTGQPRHRKLTPAPRRKRADALQSIPQRLVPELIINDSEDAQQFIDVEKDERKDTGPDDIVSETDIVHFARVMTACERNNWPYPRELVAFLERLGEDETPEDWKIEDAGEAAGEALNEIRDWADTPQAEDFGHMEERIDDIRDAIQKARDGGTDADQLVAFRTAAPRDESMFGGDYRPPAPAPTAPSGSREPAGSSPADISGGQSGYVNQDRGVAGAGSQSAPGARTVTPDSAGGSSLFGPGAGGQQAAPSGMIGPGASGQPGAGAPPPGGAAGAGTTPGGTPGTSGWSHPGGAAGIGGGGQQPGAGGAAPGGNQIGQGDYKINQGDTLSDIAQRSGYGGDYNSLAQQNQIADPNKINAGDTIKIGDPKAGGGGGQAGGEQNQWGNGNGPQATDTPATNAPGGPLNQNSGGPGADASAATNPTNDLTNPGLTTPAAPPSNPAQTGSNPATPQNTPQVDLGAAGGSPGGGGVDTNAVSGGGGGGSATDTSTSNGGAGSASPDSGGGGSGMDALSKGIGMAGDVASQISNFLPTGGKYAIFADQADYDEWQKFAYPDIGPGSHQPFAGSGPRPPLEYSTSEEYADKARKEMDDVTDLKDHNVVESDVHTSGIKRAGQGARRHVEPVVIREQKPQNGGRQTIAHAPEFDDFDPYSRTAASFEDPYDQGGAEAAAVRTAAAGGDFVAQFQQTAGAELMRSTGSSQQDNFDIAEAAAGFLQKTAGRNYSLAEQAELIREGDIGGAGNLDQLQLAGTHYQDESKNSVGLW